MSPLSRLVIVVALLAVVFVIASRGQHPPSDAIAFAENRTRCLAHCLTYKVCLKRRSRNRSRPNSFFLQSPNPLSAERTASSNISRATSASSELSFLLSQCFTICYEREENGNIFRNRTHCRATCEEVSVGPQRLF